MREALGEKFLATGALYLGNWLTDIRQLVDPIAYSQFAQSIAGALRTVAKEIIDTLPEGEPATTLKGRVDAAVAEMTGALEIILAPNDSPEKISLGELFRYLMFVIGFLKFASVSAKPELRIPYELYERLFGAPNVSADASRSVMRPWEFSRYLPHEHLDRPPLDPNMPDPAYAPRLGPSLQSGARSAKRRTQTIPDLYSYLRDDLEMMAGNLARVDLFCEAHLQGKVSGAPAAWAEVIALLGHTLHQVEDFFAHSNFVELSSHALGANVFEKLIGVDHSRAEVERAHNIVSRRLKRYGDPIPPRVAEIQDEDWIVTGFFDTRDTLISIAHFIEEALESADEVHAVSRSGSADDSKVPWFLQLIEFLANPWYAIERGTAVATLLSDVTRQRIAKTKIIDPTLRDRISVDLAIAFIPLQRAPVRVVESFRAFVMLAIRQDSDRPSAATVMADLLRIRDAFLSPLRWLEMMLPPILRVVFRENLAIGVGKITEALGADRIGCHSLLAKDYGTEPLFQMQFECSKAIHWYIVATLLRWRKPDPTHIDWLDLLEFFMANPLPPNTTTAGRPPARFAVTVIHTVTEGDALASSDPTRSLESRYKASAVDAARFTWRSIADANFDTYGKPVAEVREKINLALSRNSWGRPVKPPNFAFREGLKLLIPDQRAKIHSRSGGAEWFKAIVDHGWRIFPGFTDETSGEVHPPLQHHVLRSCPSSQVLSTVSRGNRLREAAVLLFTRKADRRR